MAKFFLVLTIIAAGAAAGLGYKTYQQIGVVKTDLSTTKANLATTKNELAATKTTLASTQKERDDFHTKFDAETAEAQTLQTEKDQLTAQLADSKTQLDAANAKLADVQKQLDEVRAEIKGTTPDGGSTTLKQVIDQLKQKIAEDELLQKALQAKADEADKRAAALQKKEDDRVAKQNQKGLEGMVMAVNPGYGFVVISLGDHQGAIPNAVVLVKRGDTFIAKLKITSVEPLVSIADILSDSVAKGQRVLPGDKVIFTGDEVNQ